MSNPIRDLFSFVDHLGVPSMMQTEVGGGFEDTVKVQVPSRVLIELRRLIADPPKSVKSMRRIDDLTLDEMREALRDFQTYCYAEGGDEPDATWNPDRPHDIGDHDIADAALGLLDNLGLEPRKEDDGKLLSD